MEIKPNNLQEAIEKLDILIQNNIKCKEDQDFLDEILKTENKFVANIHMNLGMYIRNNWGLWKKEGDLYNMFVKMGLEHPDDMSGLILTSYYRQQKNLPIKITEEIKKYQDYWKNIKTNGLNTITFKV